MKARCQCGQLGATVPGPGDQIVACHCLACQRRTGAPFGVIAYYDRAVVTLTGEVREYSRVADSGNSFTTGFCPTCGSTLYARADKHPQMIGITVGSFADPGHPPPHRAVFEDTRHGWFAFAAEMAHFPQGRT